MNIRNIPMPNNKYQLKCPYVMTPTRIVVHNTANDASAENEIKYMTSNSNSTSFHVAVDDKEIIKCIPFTRNSWNAGDGAKGKGNREGISIEICYSKSGGERFIKAEKLTAEYIASLLKYYKWGIDRVTKHQDYSGKKCPHRTLDMGWDRFIKMVESYLKPDTPKPVAKYNLKRLLKIGSNGADVKKLQTELRLRGYKDKLGRPLKIDGDFGSNTHNAVVKFQRASVLEDDGKVGPVTAKKIGWTFNGK